MNPVLGGIALAIVAAAVVTVGAHDARSTVLGLAVVLIATPVMAEPVPAAAGLAARFVAAILAAYLLWIVTRDRPRTGRPGLPGASTEGSRIGWPADVLVGAAAFVVGFAAHGLGAPALGPSLASATGFAVAAVGLSAALTGRDVLRLGLGSLLLVDAGLIVRSALGGTPGDLEQLITAGAIVVLTGTLAALAATARADGPGGFAFSLDRPRRRHEPDAHPLDVG
jgi:hypothetical protein